MSVGALNHVKIDHHFVIKCGGRADERRVCGLSRNPRKITPARVAAPPRPPRGVFGAVFLMGRDLACGASSVSKGSDGARPQVHHPPVAHSVARGLAPSDDVLGRVQHPALGATARRGAGRRPSLGVLRRRTGRRLVATRKRGRLDARGELRGLVERVLVSLRDDDVCRIRRLRAGDAPGETDGRGLRLVVYALFLALHRRRRGRDAARGRAGEGLRIRRRAREPPKGPAHRGGRHRALPGRRSLPSAFERARSFARRAVPDRPVEMLGETIRSEEFRVETCRRRGYSAKTGSRRRRGRDVDIPWRRGRGDGRDVDISWRRGRGDGRDVDIPWRRGHGDGRDVDIHWRRVAATAATWIFIGGESRRRPRRG